MKAAKHALWIVPVVVVVAMILPLFLVGGVSMKWAESITVAEALAARSGKPMMVFFYYPEAPASAELEQNTFNDANVARALRHFVCARVHSFDEQAVTSRYRVASAPVVVFLHPSGKELGRKIGDMPPAKFTSVVNLMYEVLQLSARAMEEPMDFDLACTLAMKYDEIILVGRELERRAIGEEDLNYTVAINLFERAIGVPGEHPADKMVDMLLRVARMFKDYRSRPDLAAENLRRILSDYPDHPKASEAAFRLVEALLLSGKPAEAEAILREFPEKYPNSPDLPTVEGMLKSLESLGDGVPPQ